MLLALLLAACAPVQLRTPAVEPVPWHAYDVAALQAAMASGQVDAAALVAHYRTRIENIDDAGPLLNAVVELNPDASGIAAALDQERQRGHLRGPLHGIPVLLKDNIDTDDAMATSAGSLALAGHRPGRDATLVRNLRAAGAVILGKTNLSEWANFRSPGSSSGWSARGGQTRNPHVLDRNPCGSSSGSAVAVAAGLAPLAVGTETDGSVVCPASATGVVGIKPTLGRISRHGIIPIAASYDTAGALARSVDDAVLLLEAMSGADPADPVTTATPRVLASPPQGTRPLSGVRIGVLREHFDMHPGVAEVMERALQILERQGAVLVDPVALPTRGQFGDAQWQVMLFEFREGLDRYLQETAAPVASLEALIAFNRTHAASELAWFGQQTLVLAARTSTQERARYERARETALRLAGPEGIDAVLAQHQLDALVAPTTGPAWVTDLVNGDHYPGGSSSAAAIAGYPNISVPAGDVHGLPVGISFIATAWQDQRLAALARAFEQEVGTRLAPRYLPSLQVPAPASASP